jgi:4-hydroxythreonine-4-phosphate dehydrogenase
MWIGISLGDVTGIGPEVALKAVAGQKDSDDSKYLFIGDEAVLHRTNTTLGLGLALQRYQGPDTLGRYFFHDPCPEPLPVGIAPGSPLAAQAALSYLIDAANRCLAHDLAALVTAPVNKEAIIRSGRPFIGQTEFLSELAGTNRTAMMLLGDDLHGRWLRVAVATTHVPIKLVATHLTAEKIQMVIELTIQACLDLGIERARVGVCGLNPHAGEGGEIGREEIEIIGPAVEAVRRQKKNVEGPVSADTLFYQAYHGEFDAVVAMYHDQGLVPLKMVAFDNGVNWTLGLPFVRTSPDHGTAYNIAGQGRASSRSMAAALRLARQLATCRRLS